jgi:outer membrane receptor protein involved in Fe transport
MFHRVFSVIIILVVFSFVGVYAQQTAGIISGVVKDETGGVLPGVSLTARNTGTEATRTVISDDEGRYRLPQLVPGDYELQAELAGFQTAVLQGITLSMAQEAVVSVTLRVGEISEQVVVSAEISLIETTTANVGALVDNQTIRDLPLNGRDFMQLAALQEGVVTPMSGNRTRTGDLGVKMTISGTRPNQTAVLLDGTDIKNHYGNTPGSVAGALTGVDTVREFRVITNVYSAEYGRFTGGVISAVTKSGTNEIHGTVFEFLRNSALDARNFFDAEEVPPFRRNQFGFTLGGPIVKDQTFIFGSYEGLRERLTTSFISIFPNENAHNGLLPNVRSRGRFLCDETQALCDVGVDPLVQPYMDLFPLPNGPDNGDGTGQFRFDNPQPKNQDYFVIKIDHRLSDSDNVFVRYTLDDSDSASLTETYIYGISGTQRNQFTTVEEKHIFSPNLLNEFRFAFNRSRSVDEDMENVPVAQSLWFVPDRFAMGVLQIRGGMSQFGTTTRTPQFHTQNLFQYMDNVVWTRGRHSLKMGFSGSRFQYNRANLARLNGSFAFSSLRDFMRNSSSGATLFYTDRIMTGMRSWLTGIYFQDDLQLRSNLTLNLGLRYEFVTNPNEVAGRLSSISNPSQLESRIGNPLWISNPSLKNFSPRLGFAWDPTGSGTTSIRGGFGLFHDQLLPWFYTSGRTAGRPIFVQATLERQDGITFPTELRGLTDDHPGVQRGGVSLIWEPEQPYLMQWNLSIQREILPGTALTATYSGSRGVNLIRNASINRPAGILVDGRRFFDPNTPEGTERAFPAYGGLSASIGDANSWYNGLKLGLKKRFSSGFQYQVSYHWQKFMDEASTHGGRGETRTSNTTSLDWEDHTFDRGLSGWNTPHTFSSNFSFELPFGPGRRYGGGLSGVAGKLVEGWQINGIVQLASGAALGIDGDGDITCEDFCSSRPNLKPGADNSPNTGDPNAWWGDPTDSFENQEEGYYGNLGRNTSEGPGLATFDLSINKRFTLSETANLDFRAEFFNILNRTNFGPPLRTRTAFSRGQPNGSFGRILDTQTTSRQIQFGLKLVF